MLLERIDNLISRATLLMVSKEKAFLDSIRQQVIRKGDLSFSQQDWLSRLEKKYSKDEILIEEQWKAQWNVSHREIAKQVAHYYKSNPPYFSRLVDAVFSDPDDFYLSKKEWHKFCENKYALKIRKEYDSDPKFKVGDCVQIRVSNKIKPANYSVDLRKTRLENRVCFIVKVDAAPILRAAKGSRIYQILLTGATGALYAHESDLKKKRGTNNAKKDH